MRVDNPNGTFVSITAEPVDSSRIAAIGHSILTNTMMVEFIKGGSYAYFDVPEPIFKEFKAAGSIGRYFEDNIKEKYIYRKV